MVLRRDYPYILLATLLSALAATAVADPGESIGTFALLGLMGVALVMAILINPSLGANILLIAVFSNVSRSLTDNGLPGVIKPLVAVVFVAILVRNYYVGQIPLHRPKTMRVEIFLIAYLFAVVASILVASERDLAIERIIDLANDIVIIYCILFCLRRPQDWKNAALIVVIVVTALSLLGLFQVASGNYSQTFMDFARVDTDNRLAGPINEPNMWGQVLIAVIPFVIFGILRESSKMKLFYIGSLVILLVELLNTYSRGGYLAFLVVLFLIIFFFTRFNFLVVFSAVAVGVLALPLLPPQYVERFQTITALSSENQSAVYEEASFRGRTSEILTGLTMFADHPLLGVGAANYPVNYQKYAQIIGLEVRTEQREAHSLYVEILAETGIIGFSTFMGIVLFLFLSLARMKTELSKTKYFDEWVSYISAMQVSLIGYLFAAIFLHGAYIRFLWMLTAMALALIQILYEHLDNPNYSTRQELSA